MQRSFNSRTLIALAAAGICFGCAEKTRVATGSAMVVLYESRHVTEDVDWTPVAEDHNGSMFCVVEVLVDGKSVRLLGFEPSLEYFLRYAWGGHEPFTVAVFYIGSRYNSRLFVRVENNCTHCLMVSDRQAPAFSGRIDWREVLTGGKEIVEVLPDTIFVEPSLWQHLRERNVKMPARYRPLPQLWWDSQKRQPHAAAQALDHP